MPFNNLPHLKIKIQTAAVIHTAVNNCNETLNKQRHAAKQGQKVTFVHCKWQALWVLSFYNLSVVEHNSYD